MNCVQTRELFSEYLDRRLAAWQSTAVEEHVGSCPDCRGELEALQKTVSLLGTLDEIEPSGDFIGEVERKIARGERWRRVWGWLFEPVKIKVPLEVTALAILSVMAYQLAKSPELSSERQSLAPLRELKTAPAAQRGEFARQKSRTEESYRTTEPGKPSAAMERPAPPAAPQPKKEAAGRLRLGEPAAGAQARDFVAEDTGLYLRRVKALLAGVGGRVVREEAIADKGWLLTVELPRSLRETFFSRLSEEARQEDKRELASESALSEAPEIEKKAADEARAARPADEPRITVRLRILPKR